MLYYFICVAFLSLALAHPTFHKTPLLISHRVPYVSLAALCSHSPPSFTYLDALVLLDTGSSLFWLADNKCSSCPHTNSFCPHITDSEQSVAYYKGSIRGSYSFMKVCDRRIKYFCVHSASQMQNLQGEGILGLQNIAQDNIGYSLLFEPSLNQIKGIGETKIFTQTAVTFFIGQYNAFLYTISDWEAQRKDLVPDFSKDKNSKTIIDCNNDWTFGIKEVSIFGLPLEAANLVGSFDTGASEIVLPHKLCYQIIARLQDSHSIHCSYLEKAKTGEGIYCETKIPSPFELTFADQGLQEITISDGEVVTKELNKINVLCFGQTETKVVLGYPLFKTYQATLIASGSDNARQYKVVLEDYGEDKQARNVKFGVIGYCVMVGLASWGCLQALNYWQMKRENKIII